MTRPAKRRGTSGPNIGRWARTRPAIEVTVEQATADRLTALGKTYGVGRGVVVDLALALATRNGLEQVLALAEAAGDKIDATE